MIERTPRRITSFAPDLDSITPGIVLDGNDFYPTTKGARTLPDLYALAPPLDDACLGAFSAIFTDGSNYLIAGTATGLSSITPNGDAWHTETGATPGLETILGTPSFCRWRFAQYKLAGSQTSPLVDTLIVVATQEGSGRTPLAATLARLQNPAANPPVWKPIGFVHLHDAGTDASIVAATDSALFLIEPQSAIWWASTNPTIWTPGIETLTVASSLDGTPGPITGAKALRNGIVLYKRQAIHIGYITTPPLIWQFSEISRQVGAVSQEAIVSVHDVHYFLGPDDFYTFDGFSVNPIQNVPLKEWFFEQMQGQSLTTVQARYDEARNLVFWHFGSQWVCLNVRTGNWMRGARDIEAVVDGPIVVDPVAIGRSTGLVEVDHVLRAYAQAGTRSTPAYWTTGDIGDRNFMYQLSGMRPGFEVQAGFPTLDVLSTYTPGGSYAVAQGGIPLSPDGWFNFVTTGRLQRLRLNVSADCEIAAYGLRIDQAGEV